MGIVSTLVGFGMRQAVGEPAEHVVKAVTGHFTDHGSALPQAISRANDRAWKALAVALTGDGLLAQVKLLAADGTEKGFREHVGQFLAANQGAIGSAPAELRRSCLAELKAARKAGLLSAEGLTADEVAGAAATFRRYSDPAGLIASAQEAVVKVADGLAPHYPNLARLLRQPTPAGPPLLVSAFAFFFRREVEVDDELSHGLMFDGLRQLSASQARSFVEVGAALAALGGRFDEVMEPLDRIETAVAQTRGVAAATHAEVMEMRAELGRLAGLLERLTGSRPHHGAGVVVPLLQEPPAAGMGGARTATPPAREGDAEPREQGKPVASRRTARQDVWSMEEFFAEVERSGEPELARKHAELLEALHDVPSVVPRFDRGTAEPTYRVYVAATHDLPIMKVFADGKLHAIWSGLERVRRPDLVNSYQAMVAPYCDEIGKPFARLRKKLPDMAVAQVVDLLREIADQVALPQ